MSFALAHHDLTERRRRERLVLGLAIINTTALVYCRKTGIASIRCHSSIQCELWHQHGQGEVLFANVRPLDGFGGNID